MEQSTGPKKTSDSDKLKPEHWIELARLEQESFFNRRKLEWRLSFALWTAIAAFTGAFLAKDGPQIAKDSGPFFCLLTSGYMLLFFISLCIQYLIQFAHKGDKHFFFYYMSKAAPESPSKSYPCKSSRELTDINWKWFFAHGLVSLFVLIASWVLLRQFAHHS